VSLATRRRRSPAAAAAAAGRGRAKVGRAPPRGGRVPLLSRQALRPRLTPRGYLRESRFEEAPRTACQGGGEFGGAIDRDGRSVGICSGPCPYRGDGVVLVGTRGKIQRVFLIRFWAQLALARLRSPVHSTPVRHTTHGRGRAFARAGPDNPPRDGQGTCGRCCLAARRRCLPTRPLTRGRGDGGGVVPGPTAPV